MVTIINKSNRPIGVAGQSVLPDKEIQVKDKLVYCDVYDENGLATGDKQILPGLLALKIAGHIDIREELPKVETKVEPKDEETEEKPKAKKGRKSKEE